MKPKKMSEFVPHLSFAFAILLLILFTPGAASAESSGTIFGHVTGPDGVALPGARLLLHNDITGYKSVTVSAADGSFRFYNIPFNPYHLHADLDGFEPFLVTLNVRSMAPTEVTVRLKPAGISVTVVVTSGEPAAGQLEKDTSTSHVDIDKSYVARAPAAVSSRALEELISATPGFAKDENGRFHFQGAHSQSEYVIDGQTISDQTGVTFSNSIDPGIAQSMEVIYGNVPAEYGEKVGAVINLATKSGLGSPFKAEIQSGLGSFGTFEEGASVMGGSQTWGVYASVTGSWSNRFLDPVNPDNLHNAGHTERAFLRLDYAAPKMTDMLRLTFLAGRTGRDVPNTYTQEAAGQNESVKSRDENFSLGWTHVVSSAATFDLIAFARFSEFQLLPSADDAPVWALSDRSLDNYGLAPSFTWVHGALEVKAGAVFKRFPIDERFSFGITDPALNDPASPDYNPDLAPYDLTRGASLFNFHGQRTGTYYAAYVEDNIKLQDLTLNLGFRYDHNNLPMTQSVPEPRLGAAYFIKKTGTVLRASLNRVFYTPEYENILLSSSAEAAGLVPPVVRESRALGGGLLLVPGERQNAWTAGVQQALGDHAVYAPPNVGGLFLDQTAVGTITAGPFLIDHDQALQAQLQMFYDIGRSGLWLGAGVRYDSGLVCDVGPADIASDPDNSFAVPYIVVHSGTGLDPNRIAPRAVANFSVGANLSRCGIPLTIQADLLNAFDKQGVYNIESIFGGTHVIPPRTFALHLRYRFGSEKP
jgi:hypothetical protein